MTQFKLNNGVQMPAVGLGCWLGAPGGGQRVYDMCSTALKAGYRHFDTADGYKNEEEVGRAIRDSAVPREEIFVTTKLNNTDHHRVREAFDRSLTALDIGYIDLYLVHWPQASIDGRFRQPDESPTIHETWDEMIKLLDTGKVRAIGVSNFGVPVLKSLLSKTKVVPAVNQVELHPYLPRVELREFCAQHDIIVTAYSPFGQPSTGKVSPLLVDETIKDIANRLGTTEGQVILGWALKHGIIVVPKSENPDRLKANLNPASLDSFDVKLIDEIHKKDGNHRSLLTYHKPDGTVFGWTYEQLGWELELGGKAKA
ncbi:aldo/keto reductase [Xylariales sp. PMI_506]|nr:aldo/keto reductase [Xylariales sp. PMI_506]